MLYRVMKKKIEAFFRKEEKAALMITGARQVGKTYCIREYAKENYEYVIEINFIENPQAVQLFENARNSEDILLRISALTDIPMEKGKTLIFFDEVQECKEIVTAIKFLVDEGSYRYILSGSLLGVELKDIRSVPVGYMVIYEMFPLDFFEFCRANRVSEQILEMDKTVENIRELSCEVAKGMEQVNVNMQSNYGAIEHVAAATQENSAGVEEIESMVERIKELAQSAVED